MNLSKLLLGFTFIVGLTGQVHALEEGPICKEMKRVTGEERQIKVDILEAEKDADLWLATYCTIIGPSSVAPLGAFHPSSEFPNCTLLALSQAAYSDRLDAIKQLKIRLNELTNKRLELLPRCQIEDSVYSDMYPGNPQVNR